MNTVIEIEHLGNECKNSFKVLEFLKWFSTVMCVKPAEMKPSQVPHLTSIAICVPQNYASVIAMLPTYQKVGSNCGCI